MPGKSTDEVEKALYAEIERLKTEPVTDEELQKAKNQAEASFVMTGLGVLSDAPDSSRRLPKRDLRAVSDNIRPQKKRTSSAWHGGFTEDNRTVGIPR
jgi:hypothetical protein